MAKILDQNFFNELTKELHDAINSNPDSTENIKELSRSISSISAQTFVRAYNKLVKEGYLDD